MPAIRNLGNLKFFTIINDAVYIHLGAFFQFFPLEKISGTLLVGLERMYILNNICCETVLQKQSTILQFLQ